MKAVLAVEQSDGQQGALLLWGAALDWLPLFSRDRGTEPAGSEPPVHVWVNPLMGGLCLGSSDAVWDFHVLLVREGWTSDLLELHSTSWSSVRALDQADPRVQDFRRAQHCRTGRSGPVELDVDTLLSQKYSGKSSSVKTRTESC